MNSVAHVGRRHKVRRRGEGRDMGYSTWDRGKIGSRENKGCRIGYSYFSGWVQKGVNITFQSCSRSLCALCRSLRGALSSIVLSLIKVLPIIKQAITFKHPCSPHRMTSSTYYCAWLDAIVDGTNLEMSITCFMVLFNFVVHHIQFTLVMFWTPLYTVDPRVLIYGVATPAWV